MSERRRDHSGRRAASPRRAATRRDSRAGSISGTQSTPGTRSPRRSRVALLVLAIAVVVVGGAALRVGGWWATARPRVLQAVSVAQAGDGAPALATTPTATPSSSPRATTDGRSDDTRDGGSEPAKLQVKSRGSGAFSEISSGREATGTTGRTLRYDIKLEHGLPFDQAQVARKIHRVLGDDRSWTGDGSVRFAQVSSAASADFTIYLATPGTTDQLCAPLLTRGQVSCQNGNRVVLNAKRWAFGAKAYGDDVATYQIYLINHEVGHRLGHGHVGCSRSGARASVMMQQTKGLDGCRANPWPSPDRR